MFPNTLAHVFISYSRADGDVMLRLIRFLRGKGIKVWVDNERLIPGTPLWEAEVEKAIVNAAAIVVLLSPDAKNSPWVRREISYAEDNNKQIFPILIAGDERISIPIRLTNHQRIDFRRNEEMGLNALAVALSFYLEEVERERAEAERKAKEEAELLAISKAEEELLAREKAEAEHLVAEEKAHEERKTKEEAEQIAIQKDANNINFVPQWAAVLWITIGWIMGEISGWVLDRDISIRIMNWVYVLTFSQAIEEILGSIIAKSSSTISSAIGGAIGGYITSNTLRVEHSRRLWVVLGWVIAFIFGDASSRSMSLAISGAIFGAIGGLVTTVALRIEHTRMLWIILGWTIGGATGWTLLQRIYSDWPWPITYLSFNWTTAGAIQGIVLGTLGGLVTAVALRIEHTRILWITLGWATAGAIIWAILGSISIRPILGGTIVGTLGALVTARILQIRGTALLWTILGWGIVGAFGGANFGLSARDVVSAAIGGAIMGAIGGFVMIWQLRNANSQIGHVN